MKTYESITANSALFNHTLSHENVKDFVTQIISITDMIKVENIDAKAVLQNARGDQHERVRNFYELAIPIVESYIAYCTNKSSSSHISGNQPLLSV